MLVSVSLLTSPAIPIFGLLMRVEPVYVPEIETPKGAGEMFAVTVG